MKKIREKSRTSKDFLEYGIYKWIRDGMVIIFLLICMMPIKSLAAYVPYIYETTQKNQAIEAYEEYLKGKHKCECKGRLFNFSIKSFYVLSVGKDKELVITDNETCKYGSSKHTHLLICKYRNKQIYIKGGILIPQSGLSSFYFSKANNSIKAKTRSGQWYKMGCDQSFIYHINEETKPNLSGYEECKLYKNTANNRKKVFKNIKRKNQNEQKYSDKIKKLEESYQKKLEKFYANGEKLVKDIDNSYSDLKKNSVNALSKKIETVLASNLPRSAEKALVKKITDTIQETILVKSTSYDKCKTGPQLVNKVASEIMNKNGVFTFKDNKITYRVFFNTNGTVGATMVSGTITGNGKTYTFLGTVTNKVTIQEEIKNLKKFSDTKMEEAKKEVYSECRSLLFPTELKSYLKTASKSKMYSVLKKKSPKAAAKIKKSISMVNDFIEAKKAMEGLKALNLENATESQIVKKISTYNKKIAAYEKAINKLLK